MAAKFSSVHHFGQNADFNIARSGAAFDVAMG
jgi:hypothetical protein